MRIQFVICTAECPSVGPEQVALFETVRAAYEAKGHEVITLPPQEIGGERLEVSVALREADAVVQTFARPEQAPEDQEPQSEFILIYGEPIPDVAPEGD